jgi:glycosyltransferase involved in cell wall biosynthesis
MSQRPFFSFIIPTLNSERTLEKTLASIREQEFDQEQVEILIVDGGSTDATRDFAERYGCRLLENPMVQQEYAKYIGLTEARGRAAVFIDSDESFVSRDALARRSRVFSDSPSYKFLMLSGYRKPEGASPINDYINMFSDPFAYYMTGIGGEVGLFAESWKKRYRCVEETADFIGFVVPQGRPLPTVDLCAGNTLDVDFVRSEFAAELESPMVIPRVFYMVLEKAGKVAILKDDPIVHYSADRFRTYLKKLNWRVKVNIHYQEMPGTGYSNREQYQAGWIKYKKYFFLLYGLTVIVPLLQALNKGIKTKRPVALLHPVLCFYVAVDICYQYTLKVRGKRLPLKTYGSEEKTLDFDSD